MGAILTGLLGAVTAEGVARLSKTKLSAHVGGLNAAVVLLPAVLAKDPAAIAQFVLLLLSWAGVLWGRGNAD